MLATRSEKKLATWAWTLHLLGALVTISAAAALYLVIFQPIEQRHGEIRQRSQLVTQTLRLEGQVTDKFRELRTAVAQADQQTEELLDRIPKVPRESDFLGQITTLAQEVGLEIIDYRPGATTGGAEYREMTVNLTAEGNYASICNFLHQVHRLPRLSRTHRLEIGPQPAGDAYSLQMTLIIYFAPQASLAAVGKGAHDG